MLVKEKRKSFSHERLYTKRLLIERMGKNDWNFFRSIAGDSEVYRYFKEYRRKGEELKSFFEEIVENQNQYVLSLVIKKHDETPIGIFDMYYIKNGVWLIEYALQEMYRNQGYMTEILDFLVTNNIEFLLAFKANTSISSLLLEIPAGNRFSEKLIEKIIDKHKLTYEMSINGFYPELESESGWTWYKIQV